MEKLNLHIAALLLLSCAGTTFSMFRLFAKKPELTPKQQIVLKGLTAYKWQSEVIDAKRKQINWEKDGVKDYISKCVQLNSLSNYNRALVERATGLYIGHPFNIRLKSEEELKEIVIKNVK